MNAYSGGTGSVDTAVARRRRPRRSRHTRERRAERVGVGVLVADGERVARACSRASTAAGTASAASAARSTPSVTAGRARPGLPAGVPRRPARAYRRARDGGPTRPAPGGPIAPRRCGGRIGASDRGAASARIAVSPSWGRRADRLGSDSRYGSIVCGSLPASSSSSRCRTRVPRSPRRRGGRGAPGCAGSAAAGRARGA